LSQSAKWTRIDYAQSIQSTVEQVDKQIGLRCAETSRILIFLLAEWAVRCSDRSVKLQSMEHRTEMSCV